MFGNSPFGFSGSGGGGGGGTIGGGGTLNYLCKFTPDGTTIGNSQLFDDGTSVGLGTITPTAKFQIYVDVNDITGQSGQLITNVNAGTSAAAALFFRNNDNKGFEIGVVSSNHTTYQDAYGRLSDSFYTSVVGGGDMIFKQRASGKGIKFFNAGNGVVTGQSLMNVSDNGVGFYTDSISAVVHIKGVDATSGAYALKVDNSASSPLLYVRNDGNVGIGTTSPTAKLYILQDTVSTGAKGLSVNFNTIGEVFSIDDNSFATYNGNNFTMRAGNAALNMISNGGSNPSISFKINNGAVTSGTLLGDNFNMFLQPNKYFGVGATYFAASSTLQVRGEDATSSNYVFKVDNSASSPLLYVRNDGNVAIGTSSPTSGTRFHVYRAVNDFLYEVKVENPTNGVSAASSILIQSDNGKMEFGQLSTLFTTYTGYGQTGDTFIRSGTGARNMNFLTDASNLGKFLFFSRLNPTTSASTPSLAIDGQNVAIGTQAIASATLLIKGVDSTSLNYSLKVDNSASTPLLYVRNDGNVGIGTTSPTSKLQVVGLPTYADNAAAITGGLTAGAFYIRTGHGLDVVV